MIGRWEDWRDAATIGQLLAPIRCTSSNYISTHSFTQTQNMQGFNKYVQLFWVLLVSYEEKGTILPIMTRRKGVLTKLEVNQNLWHGVSFWPCSTVGKHALGDRARKLEQGILIVRFELPFNIWWYVALDYLEECCDWWPPNSGTCNNHIGMGVRYNAEKKKVGSYYSTPIFSFRCKCHLCDGWFEIQTDPKVCMWFPFVVRWLSYVYRILVMLLFLEQGRKTKNGIRKIMAVLQFMVDPRYLYIHILQDWQFNVRHW